MDDDDTTCLGAFNDSRRFQRVVAYIYAPTQITTLRLVLKISGMECSQTGLLVYHGNGYSDMYVECSLTASRHEGGVQQCEFMCTNICPHKSVVKIYVQTQRFRPEQNDSVSICGMILKYWHFGYDIIIIMNLSPKGVLWLRAHVLYLSMNIKPLLTLKTLKGFKIM